MGKVCPLAVFWLLIIKTRSRHQDTLSTARSTFNIETNCGRSFALASPRLRTTQSGSLRDSLSNCFFAPTDLPEQEQGTRRACLKRLVCLKIPWDRCAAGGQRTGARPQRGPRVNLTRFVGGGQLAFSLAGMNVRYAHSDIGTLPLLMFLRRVMRE